MKTFDLKQEVVLLDGTSLTGVVIDKAYQSEDGELVVVYKVSVNGSDGRWYHHDELNAALAPHADASADFRRAVAIITEDGLCAVDAELPVVNASADGVDDDPVLAYEEMEAERNQWRQSWHDENRRLGQLAQEWRDVDQRRGELEAQLAASESALAAAVSALRPFAFAYHVFSDQFESDYGNIINWQTDFANVNAVTEWYKQALAIVGVEQAASAPTAGEGGERDNS
jgi:hypothetical protein